MTTRAAMSPTDAECERFLPIVTRIAAKMANHLPADVMVADLVAFGWVGFVEAFARRPSTMEPYEFELYAAARVRGAMMDHLRQLDPASRDLRRMARRVAETVDALSKEGDGPPATGSVAEALELTADEYDALALELMHVERHRVDALDVDRVANAPENSPDRIAEARQLEEGVRFAFSKLPERHRTALKLHYFAGKTLREIGALLAVTESRVSQLHREAFDQLRADLQPFRASVLPKF